MHTIKIIVKNKKVLPKLQKLLNQFNENDITIAITKEMLEKIKNKRIKNYSDAYIKKHWRKFIYTSVGDFGIDDHEYLLEHYGEKLLKDYENTI